MECEAFKDLGQVQWEVEETLGGLLGSWGVGRTVGIVPSFPARLSRTVQHRVGAGQGPELLA